MANRYPRATDGDGLLLGDLEAGARIGEYVVEGRLATRGTGHVYEAVHVVLPRRVTIKVMPAAQEWVRAIALDLLREACIIDALDHPGIPRLYECGTLSDRRPWIATELVEGTSVAAVSATRAMSANEIACLVRDVAEVLDHAHRRGLVHRNMTPSTIVLPAGPRRFPICVVDWSGARTLDSSSPLPMLTAARARPYVAPEQLAGEVIDGRADVYSLGVIARELLRDVAPDAAPPVLTALLERMRSRDRDQRPTSDMVFDAAAWVVTQLEPEHAIPDAIDDDATLPIAAPPIPHAITSEKTPNVFGEIKPRDERP